MLSQSRNVRYCLVSGTVGGAGNSSESRLPGWVSHRLPSHVSVSPALSPLTPTSSPKTSQWHHSFLNAIEQLEFSARSLFSFCTSTRASLPIILHQLVKTPFETVNQVHCEFRSHCSTQEPRDKSRQPPVCQFQSYLFSKVHLCVDSLNASTS